MLSSQQLTVSPFVTSLVLVVIQSIPGGHWFRQSRWYLITSDVLMLLNTSSVMFLGSSGVLDLATLYPIATGNPATVDLPGGNLKEWLPS